MKTFLFSTISINDLDSVLISRTISIYSMIKSIYSWKVSNVCVTLLPQYKDHGKSYQIYRPFTFADHSCGVCFAQCGLELERGE